MSSDTKHVAAAPDGASNAPQALIVQAVAGSGRVGSLDGPLSRGQFRWPSGLCRFGDSLIVADYGNSTLRQVTDVLGVAEPMASETDNSAEFESRAVPLLMTAIAVLPKELARLMAQYARPDGRITTIAGISGKFGHVDGHALGEALFENHGLECVAVDESDGVAGPRLIIGEVAHVRSLSFRTGLVTTIAGSGYGHLDGPGSVARFRTVLSVAVSPNGTVYVSNRGTFLIRRISPSAERWVTTLIGEPFSDDSKSTRYASSSVECFRQSIYAPCAMALHVSDADRVRDTDADRDVGVLYVGCGFGVHAFDLARGECKYFAGADHRTVTGLAVTEDGSRLFAVTPASVEMWDTRTGTRTALVQDRYFSKDAFRAGVVSDNIVTTACFGVALGCVIDKATRSLVMVDCQANLLFRLRGVDV